MKGSLTKEQREEIEREVKQCIWFGAKDAMAWALTAYYGACRECRPPAGEPWDGWTSQSGFLGEFHHQLTELLSVEALRRDLPHTGCQSAELVWADDGPSWPRFFGRYRGRLPGLKDAANCDEFAAVHDHNLPPCSDENATLTAEGVPGAA